MARSIASRFPRRNQGRPGCTAELTASRCRDPATPPLKTPRTPSSICQVSRIPPRRVHRLGDRDIARGLTSALCLRAAGRNRFIAPLRGPVQTVDLSDAAQTAQCASLIALHVVASCGMNSAIMRGVASSPDGAKRNPGALARGSIDHAFRCAPCGLRLLRHSHLYDRN